MQRLIALTAILAALAGGTALADTVKIDHIKRHYYMTHPQINPNQIVPMGPELDFTSPPGREHLGT